MSDADKARGGDMGARVKPLVWQDFSDRGAKAQAWNEANYMIQRWSDKRWEISASYPGYSTFIEETDRFYPTLAVAKAAAQLDYEARILAALEPAPDLAELTDPVAVHANMLRGTIAKPTVEQIIHLYGVDALCKALAPVIVREAGHDPAPDLAELVEAAKGLNTIVEGIQGAMDHGVWRDEKGLRFKDTPQWVTFYNALAKIKEPQK